MDQQVIDAATTEALEQMKAIVEGLVASGDTFTELALMVGTLDPFEEPLLEPVIFAIKPECIHPPIVGAKFVELLIGIAEESGAAAVVRAHEADDEYYKPWISVETQGEQLRYMPVAMPTGGQWVWSTVSTTWELPILRPNRSN
jgi:hypothetical protein